MGLSRSGIAFLAAASTYGVNFHRTLTIGRQQTFVGARTLRAAMREGGICVDRREALHILMEGSGYCEALLRRLGARTTDSLDASDYEDATIISDLNKESPRELRARYSAVIDVGSLEHVFNFPVALAGCLDTVAVGGHYLAVTPVNNYAGHGFYQFSPELFFRVLSEQNGFALRCMLWRSEHPCARWYEVADPVRVRQRVERIGAVPSQLYIAARRIDRGPVLVEAPQQSDYAAVWGATDGKTMDARRAERSAYVSRRIYERSPPVVRDTWRWLRWGGLPPVAEEALRLVHRLSEVRAGGESFSSVSLQDVVSERLRVDYDVKGLPRG
jgi:hypothetical protein